MSTRGHDDPGAGPFAVDPCRACGPPARPNGWRARAAVWAAGGAVAAGAAAATAHGLYEVAAASGVPAGLAWIYPLITDGLALVAYAATSRLHGPAARYAWTVVVLAAGLSGLAQAAFLAAGPAVPTDGAAGGPGALLRFGVGAWPAIAAAVVAHLLYLLAAPAAPASADTTRSTTPLPEPRAVAAADHSPGADRSPLDRPAGVHEPAAVHAPHAFTAAFTDQRNTVHTHVQLNPPDAGDPAAEPSSAGPEPSASAPEGPRERARTAAEAHRAARGTWPTVRALAGAAEVSVGLASTVLRHLREHTDTDPTPERAQP